MATGNHVTAAMPSDEGTDHLRNLIASQGLCRVAQVLGVDQEMLGAWTRDGLPESQWDEVRRLCAKYAHTDIGQQTTDFCAATVFPLHIRHG